MLNPATFPDLAFISWNPDPDVFNIPFTGRPVKWYGLFFAMASVMSYFIMHFIYRKEGRPLAELGDMTVYLVVAATLGGRLGHVLFYDPAYYFAHPAEIFMIWRGGLASHGGAIGILVALYLFARKTKVPYLWLLDRAVIIVALVGAMIRLGNLMNSEIIGTPTNLPWAFIFTRVDNIPRHPAQLYESLECFLLCGFLFYAWYKKRDTLKNGVLFSWFLIILFTMRFFLEFLKVSQEQFEETMLLNMGQILSIPFILAGISLLLFIRNQKLDIPPKKHSSQIGGKRKVK
jgi:phosphatidylglycerol:prolipoprotein diacylglycerol transferase